LVKHFLLYEVLNFEHSLFIKVVCVYLKPSSLYVISSKEETPKDDTDNKSDEKDETVDEEDSADEENKEDTADKEEPSDKEESNDKGDDEKSNDIFAGL
jgi:hypothetical protein